MGLFVVWFVSMSNAATLSRRPPPRVEPPPPAEARRQRGRALFALGLKRAWEGILPKVSVALAGIITLFMLGIALASARRDVQLTHVAPATASLLAWGSGVLIAFAGAVRMFERDRADGIRVLLDARGRGVMSYVVARAGGLALLLALPVLVGSTLTGLAAAAAATEWSRTVDALEGTAAAIAYSIAFAAILAPVAVAALGARSRAGGYGFLFIVLVLPAVFSGLTAKIVPGPWGGLVSIPGVVDGVRDGLMPPYDLLQTLRALLVLLVLGGIAVAVIRGQLARDTTEAARRRDP
ncbi:hypothetical protein BH09MYX1_BH09MYX1_39110 [soil metagenome]